MNILNGKVFVFLVLSFWSCKNAKEDASAPEQASDAVEELSPNFALHEEVMKIHDEVMPKLDNIYRKKEELKTMITSDMPDDRKKQIEATIAKLDSASDGMFTWMNKYNPIPDSLGEEKARVYLENEMENIKRVRADILQALEEAEKY